VRKLIHWRRTPVTVWKKPTEEMIMDRSKVEVVAFHPDGDQVAVRFTGHTGFAALTMDECANIQLSTLPAPSRWPMARLGRMGEIETHLRYDSFHEKVISRDGATVSTNPDRGPSVFFVDGDQVLRVDVPDTGLMQDVRCLDERGLRIVKAVLDTAQNVIDSALDARMAAS
jgi:hypothetical protein